MKKLLITFLILFILSKESFASVSWITSTNVNWIIDITSSNVIPASTTSSIIDEVVLIRSNSAIITNNNANAKVDITNSAFKIWDIDIPFGYWNNTDTASEINFTDSYIEWNIANARKNMRITKLIWTHLRSTNTWNAWLAFVYTQAWNKAVIDAKDGKPTVIDGIYVHEIAWKPLTFQNAIYKNNGINILNWEAWELPIRWVSFGAWTRTWTNYTWNDWIVYNTYDAWLWAWNSANKFRFYDCSINLSKIAINLATTTWTELIFKYFSRSEKYLLWNNPYSWARILFTPTANSWVSSQTSFERTTNWNWFLTDGISEYKTIDFLVQNTVDSWTTRSSWLTDPATIRNYTLKNITWNRTIRWFNINEQIENITPSSKVWSLENPSNVYLTSDQNITWTEIQASNITWISFNKSTKTLTINQNKSLQDIYNYYKYWISLSSQMTHLNFMTVNWGVLNISDWNLLIDTSSWIVNSSSNIKSIKTTWTISVSNGWIINALYEDSTANSWVKIYTPYNNQIVRVYGSISDLNNNTNSLWTYTSDINGELIYRYNSNISTKRYFKTELSSTIWKWSMKWYVLNAWLDNELDMRTGWDFTYINLQLRQIKGSWFDSNLHSLKWQYSTWWLVLSTVDKSSIAEYVKTKMEEPSWLLSKIYSLLQEIFTRIISIKYDTQKIN